MVNLWEHKSSQINKYKIQGKPWILFGMKLKYYCELKCILLIE